MQGAIFSELGAIISELGAVIRNVETGLFISCDDHCYAASQHQHARSAFYIFTLLLSIVKAGLFIFRDAPVISARCKRNSL